MTFDQILAMLVGWTFICALGLAVALTYDVASTTPQIQMDCAQDRLAHLAPRYEQ